MCVNNEMMPGIITYSPIARPLYCAFRWLPIISYLARQLPDLMAAFLPRALLGFVVSKLSRVRSPLLNIHSHKRHFWSKYIMERPASTVLVSYRGCSMRSFPHVVFMFFLGITAEVYVSMDTSLILLSHERDVWSKCTVGQLRAWMLYYGCPMIGKGLSNQWVQTKLYFVEP